MQPGAIVVLPTLMCLQCFTIDADANVIAVHIRSKTKQKNKQTNKQKKKQTNKQTNIKTKNKKTKKTSPVHFIPYCQGKSLFNISREL